MTAEQMKPVDPLYVYEVGSGNEPVILLHGLSKSFKYWEVHIIHISSDQAAHLRFNFAPSVLCWKFFNFSQWWLEWTRKNITILYPTY